MSTALRKPDALHDLLGDVLDLLVIVSEWADREADVSDGPGGEDGPNWLPNRAMRVQTALEGSDYEDGLLARVQKAYEQGA